MNSVSFDVVIVGGGTTGIPAAIAVAGRGGKVCMVEATGALGGTCAISWGQMSGAGTRIQAEKGIEDTWQDHYEDAVRITQGTGKGDFLRLATRIQGPFIDWLEENGFEMAPEVPGILYAHEPYSAARLYWGNERGQSICKVLFELLQPLIDDGSVSVRLNTAMSEIVCDGNGGVIGVLTESGEEILGRSTFLATGGYSGNKEFYEQMHPGVTLYPGTWEHSRGDGIKAAMGIGAASWNEENFSLAMGGIYDSTTQYPRYCGIGGLTPQVRLPWEILVNQEGRRFMAEDHESYEYRATHLRRQTGNRAWLVFDEAIRENAPNVFMRWSGETLEKLYNNGRTVKKGSSLDELAERCGITDKAALANSVEEYNRACESGKDDFCRKHFPQKIESAPFYAIEIASYAVRGCIGIKVDTRFRVLGKSGGPIRNLFAAGEILGGGLFGAAAVAGMGITPALAFGQYVGETLIPVGEDRP